MNGGPGRLVVHTGGRGLVRVTVTSTDTPAPPLADSLLAVWEDIAEGSFTIESAELCFDGFSGEISQRIPPSRARPAQSAGVRSGTNRILGHLQDTGSPTADTAPLQTGRNQSAPRTSSSTGTGSPETVSEQATPPNRSNPPLRRETCPHSAPRIAVLPSRNPALAVLPESKAPNRVCYRRTRTRRRGASSLRPQDLRHLRRPAVRRRVRSPTDVPERNPALPNPCREPA